MFRRTDIWCRNDEWLPEATRCFVAVGLLPLTLDFKT